MPILVGQSGGILLASMVAFWIDITMCRDLRVGYLAAIKLPRSAADATLHGICENGYRANTHRIDGGPLVKRTRDLWLFGYTVRVRDICQRCEWDGATLFLDPVGRKYCLRQGWFVFDELLR